MRKLCLFVLLGLLFLRPVPARAWVASGTPLSIQSFATGLDNATQIAVDSSGNVFASGYEPCCTLGNKGIAKYDPLGSFVTKFGPFGSTGVFADLTNDILVMHYQGDEVYKFDNSGTPIVITGTDLGDYAYNAPYSGAVDSNGNIYIANAFSNEILKFDNSYNHVATITGNSGAFNTPEAVAVDSSNNLYVLDSGNNRVQKFDSSGTWLLTVTGDSGAWNYPEAMTVDTNGNIYVGDSGNDRIQIFDTSGTFQQTITNATITTAIGSLSYMGGMGIFNPGTLYVGDSTRVIKISFDHADPVTSINSLPSNSTTDTTPSITGSTTDALTNITAVEYSIDAGAYAPCFADDAAYDEATESFSCTVSPALNVGSHSISVRATDSKNNVNVGGTIASYSFSVTAGPTPTPDPTLAPEGDGNPNDVNTYCSNLAPVSAPLLSQVTRNGSVATLSYSPVSTIPTEYQLMYGYAPNDERFSTTIKATFASGILRYSVGELDPTRTYYFWMRAMNGCAPGPWSNTISSSPNGGVKLESSPTPSKKPLLSPSPSPIPSTESTLMPSSTPADILELSDLPSLTQATVTISDPLGLPIKSLELEVVSSSNEVVFDGKTNEQGTFELTTEPGNYTVTTHYNQANQEMGMILSASVSDVRLTLPMPISETIKRQIQAPVDASYITKAGAAAVVVNTTIVNIAGLLIISKVIVGSLLQIYQVTARSILRMPFDYLSSLIQYIGLRTIALLSPLFPSLSRRHIELGIVFDAITLKPIAIAYVLLFSKSGNLKTDFTDEQGKFSFTDVIPDDYSMRSERVGYIFPSTLITTPKTIDFDHVYLQGENVPVSKENNPLDKIVLPMDPKSGASAWTKTKHQLSKLRIPAYGLSFVITGVAIATNPSMFNIVVASTLTLYSLYKYRASRLGL